MSLVVPIFDEEEVIPKFFERVLPILSSVTDEFEIVCVNDGSTDASIDVLLASRETEPRIVIVDLSRNFGKEIALTAGIDFARGAAVIPIDADLQDPPELITKMVEKWREGYDVVLAAWEACANAVEHPAGGDGTFLLRATLQSSSVAITVEDEGPWLADAKRAERGLGLHLMRSLMSSVEIDSSRTGTVVRLEKALAPDGAPLLRTAR